MFQQVFDKKQVDKLAEAGLLCTTTNFLRGRVQPYGYTGKQNDLPSAHAATGRYRNDNWKFFILIED